MRMLTGMTVLYFRRMLQLRAGRNAWLKGIRQVMVQYRIHLKISIMQHSWHIMHYQDLVGRIM